MVIADVCIEYLQVVRDIIPVVGSESGSKILKAVSPLLTSVGLDVRLPICDLLDALAKSDPSFLFVVIIVFGVLFMWLLLLEELLLSVLEL